MTMTSITRDTGRGLLRRELWSDDGCGSPAAALNSRGPETEYAPISGHSLVASDTKLVERHSLQWP
jgi:hypothetical protein